MAKRYFTDESLQHFVDTITAYVNNSVNNILPAVSSADEGKFLRVSSNGAWEAIAISSAEEASF